MVSLKPEGYPHTTLTPLIIHKRNISKLVTRYEVEYMHNNNGKIRGIKMILKND